MNTVRKNYFFQVAYQILILIIPLITAPYISRTIGPESIGIQTLTFNVSNYFVIFSMLGLAKYGNRCVSEIKDDKNALNEVFSELLFIHICLAFVATAFYLSYAFLLGGALKVYYLISGIYLIGTFFDINWLFFGLEEFKITVIRNLFVKIVSTILIFVFIKSQADLWIYILILASSQLLSYTFLWPYLRGRVSFKKISLRLAFKKHIKGLAILSIPIIAVSLYTSMDKIMIGTIYSETELGFYESSEKIIVLIMAIITSLGTVVMPRISYLSNKNDDADLIKTIDNSNYFNCFITCGCMFGIASIAKDFIPFFYGEDFFGSVVILEMLSTVIIFSSLSDISRNMYLIPKKKDNVYVIAVCSGAIINFILNFILIREYGGRGAAVATICAEVIVCTIQMVYSFRGIRLKKFYKHLIAFMVFGTIMFLINYFMVLNYSHMINFIIKMLVGGVAYSLMSLCYYVVNKKISAKRRLSAE